MVDVDRVRVTIQVPALQTIEDDGDIRGTSVSISIQLQYNGGGYTTVVDDTITGKTSDNYQRDYMLTLTGSFPVDVRVVRNTATQQAKGCQILLTGLAIQKLLTRSCDTRIPHLLFLNLMHVSFGISHSVNIWFGALKSRSLITQQ